MSNHLGPLAPLLILADQAIVSVVNFVSAILLARLLGPEAFGFYTLLWTAFLFANGLQWCLVISPLQSIGARRMNREGTLYFSTVFYQQLIFCGAISLVAFLAVSLIQSQGWLFGNQIILGLRLPLMVAVALFLTQVQDYLRRFLLLKGALVRALAADVLRYGGFIASLLFLWNSDRKDLSVVFAALSLSNLVGIAAGGLPWRHRKARLRFFRNVWERHFRFSKWILPATLLQWINSNVMYYAATSFLGAPSAGIIKACQTVVAPVAVLLEALENLVPVEAAKRYGKEGNRGLRRYLLRSAALTLGSAAAFVAVICIAPGAWLRLFYGDRFAGQNHIVVGFGLSNLLLLSAFFVNVLNRTHEHTQVIFHANFLATVWAVGSSIALIRYWGLPGAVVSLAISHVVRLAILAYRGLREP